MVQRILQQSGRFIPKAGRLSHRDFYQQANFATSLLSLFESPLRISQCISDNPVNNVFQEGPDDTDTIGLGIWMTFLIRLRHSRSSCHSQRLPETGDTTTFPVCQYIFCVSEAPYQQEAHANRCFVIKHLFSTKNFAWQDENHSKTLNV